MRAIIKNTKNDDFTLRLICIGVLFCLFVAHFFGCAMAPPPDRGEFVWTCPKVCEEMYRGDQAKIDECVLDCKKE